MGPALLIPSFPLRHYMLCGRALVGTVAGRVGLVNDQWLLGSGWVHSNADLNSLAQFALVSQPSPLFNSNANGIGDITLRCFFAP